jgi:hypothetical protein
MVRVTLGNTTTGPVMIYGLLALVQVVLLKIPPETFVWAYVLAKPLKKINNNNSFFIDYFYIYLVNK